MGGSGNAAHPSESPSARLKSAWEESTSAFLRSRGFSPEGKALLLAVSGGADSMAMLRYFAETRHPQSRLCVLHIHHGLRPEADAEEALVRAFCHAVQIPCSVARLLPETRPARKSLEMWARDERYRCFEEEALRTNSDFILTAHHRNDLVETVLQRLGRGTGFKGLQGIPFSRENGIIRPFLNRTRAEIIQYLELTATPWLEDASNHDVSIERNWYRSHLIPKWKGQNPHLEEQVARIAFAAQEMWPRMQSLAPEIRYESHGPNRPYLTFLAIEEALPQSESLKAALEALLAATCEWAREKEVEPPPMTGVTRKILDEFGRQARQGLRGLGLALSPQWSFNAENEGLFCAIGSIPPYAEKGKEHLWPEVDWIPENGAVSGRWGERNYILTVRTYSVDDKPGFPAPGMPIALFDAGLLSCRLRIRTRQKGDKFSPLGVSSRSRKLKTFLNEKKVPLSERDKLPLLCVKDQVVWIPGYGLSEFHRIGDATRRILELVWQWENL